MICFMTARDVTVDTPFSSTGVLFAQLGRTARRWFGAALAPLELKPPQVGALHQLRSGPMSQQALGDALDIDASNLVAILNDLEDKGLITRRRDPDDRRRHIVEITETGVGRLADVGVVVADVEERLVAALDDEQRAQLHELLTTIAASLCAAGPCPDDPLSDQDDRC
jgi:MarR family transcriptional regulator, lower aerobic nicotinate degradation pathway regulator